MGVIPLELDTRIDDGSRIATADMTLELYRNYKKKTLWTPELYMNHTLFYGDMSNLDYFMDELLKQTKNTSDVHFFNYASVDINNSNFSSNDRLLQHQISFEDALNIAFEACMQRAVKCQSQGFLSPPSRKFDSLVFVLSSNEIRKLYQNEELYEKFTTMLSDGATFRAPMFLLIENVTAEWKRLLPELEWVGFLGDNNEDFAINYYKNLEPGLFNVGQVKIGIGFTKGSHRLIALQSLKYKPNEWRNAIVARKNAERKVYNDFLKGLDNGD